jgi:hypothetical protein
VRPGGLNECNRLVTSTILSARMVHTCPVCGFTELAEAAYDNAGCASFEICPSCGTEFGYHDAKESHAELRKRWLAAGAPWSSRAIPSPPNWDPLQQLRIAGMGK